MGSIILLRHAPTVASASGLASGRSSLEMPISPGTEPRSGLDTRAIELVATSRYRRTKDTVDLLGLGGVRLLESDAIDEPDYGRFDGGPWGAFGAWARSHGLYDVAPGADISWLGQLHRALSWLGGPQFESSSGDALVVCHGYLWAATQRFLADSATPDIANISSPPYLTPLRAERADFARFDAALRDGAEEPLLRSAP